jgi:DNA-binding HxlR family transcriptional regulator
VSRAEPDIAGGQVAEGIIIGGVDHQRLFREVGNQRCDARNAGPLRFAELQRRVEGVNQKMLIQQLKDLEKDGIVIRTIYPQVPPKVDYALSDMGLALGPSIKCLIDGAFMRRQSSACRLTKDSSTLRHAQKNWRRGSWIKDRQQCDENEHKALRHSRKQVNRHGSVVSSGGAPGAGKAAASGPAEQTDCIVIFPGDALPSVKQACPCAASPSRRHSTGRSGVANTLLPGDRGLLVENLRMK